jgi:hypothetical protein
MPTAVLLVKVSPVSSWLVEGLFDEDESPGTCGAA